MNTQVTEARPLRVLIVDDEALARQRMRRLLGEIPLVDIVGECANGQEALEAIAASPLDLILLDVRMPGMGGFEVARAIASSRAPLVIFVTAYDEHALSAFEVHAIDYLMKPVEPERFRDAVERARQMVAGAAAAARHAQLVAFLREQFGDVASPAPVPAAGTDAMTQGSLPRAGAVSGGERAPAGPTRFLVRSHERMYFVNVNDVDWFEAYGNYVRLHVGKTVHLVRDTMNRIEQTVDPDRFARVHRSAIVNLDRVVRFDLWGSGDYVAVLKDGTRVKLSRWYRSRIEERGI